MVGLLPSPSRVVTYALVPTVNVVFTPFTVGTNAYVTTLDGEGNNPTIQMLLIGDVVVPAPGAAALIGLAGLVVGRRRRN